MRDETEARAPWVGSLSSDFGWALRAMSKGFVSLATDAVLDIPSGARGYLVLVAVSESSAPSQLALASQLLIDKTQMTSVLGQLEAGSLVERTPDPADKRARLINITAKGRRRLEQARRELVEVEERVLAPLDEEGRESFRVMLAEVAAGLTGLDGGEAVPVLSGEDGA